MSLFSRLAKFAKKVVRKLAPVASIVAPFIPAIGPLAGTILGGLTSQVGTPGIAPPDVATPRTMPGSGAVVTGVRRQRRDRGQGVRDRRAAAAARAVRPRTPPAAVRGDLGPRMTIPRFGPGQGPTGPTGRNVITLPPIGTTRTNQMSIFAALPALGRVGTAIGRGLTGRVAAGTGLGIALGQTLGGGGAVGGNPCPSGQHLNKQDGVGGAKGTYCVRNRRMNVGNARAARRSVRRLKGARTLLKDIEKMMPSKPRARRAPVHHDHHAHSSH